MHPTVDTENAIRQKVTSEQTGTTAAMATKMKKAIEEKVAEKMEALLTGSESKDLGLKRKADSQDGRPRKRARFASNQGPEEDEWDIDVCSCSALVYDCDSDSAPQGNIVLRVNQPRFLAIFRNEELVRWVEQRIGKATSLVYAELLKHVEKHNVVHRTPHGLVDTSKSMNKYLFAMKISNRLPL